MHARKRARIRMYMQCVNYIKLYSLQIARRQGSMKANATMTSSISHLHLIISNHVILAQPLLLQSSKLRLKVTCVQLQVSPKTPVGHFVTPLVRELLASCEMLAKCNTSTSRSTKLARAAAAAAIFLRRNTTLYRRSVSLQPGAWHICDLAPPHVLFSSTHM